MSGSSTAASDGEGLPVSDGEDLPLSEGDGGSRAYLGMIQVLSNHVNENL